MSDFPDDFGMQIFSQFGPYQKAAAADNITGVATVDVLTVTGKGKTYGGYMRLVKTGGTWDLNMALVIDGETTGYFTPKTLLDWAADTKNMPMAIGRYDIAADEIVVLFQSDITFGLTYTVRLQALAGAGPISYSIAVFYAQII